MVDRSTIKQYINSTLNRYHIQTVGFDVFENYNRDSYTIRIESNSTMVIFVCDSDNYKDKISEYVKRYLI